MQNRTFLCLLGSIAVLSPVWQGCSSDAKTEVSVNASPDASDDATEEATADAAQDASVEADGMSPPDATDDGSADASDAVSDVAPDVAAEVGEDALPDVVQDTSVEADEDAPDDAAVDASDEVGEDAAPDAAFYCPSCEELLTWDTTQNNNSTYGEISTLSVWPDAYAWQMIDECPGWGIYQGHQGGIGDTLEISSCNDGLVLVWAYGYFSHISVSEGWTGKTDTDLAIGTSYDVFIATYPGYDSNSTLINAGGYASLHYAGGFAIFQDSLLNKLHVY